eukprot:TRINITY_DN7504_c0_g1_i1.p1 TRINITY_DN7504_c0_g1~~TRINITY_DN7504_c0_g1_i1.p1  ORF type:complete len:355 (+),score=29.37 TRINITY_DN7504_c0_g1_i1:180-1244(+)
MLALAVVLFFFCLLSASSCLLFVIYVVRKGLVRTTLMKQVVALCICDMLTNLWEMFHCQSYINFPGVCVDVAGCAGFLPTLRTLQTASALWCTQVAVGIFMAVSQTSLAPFRYICLVWPLAVLLNAFFWITAFGGDVWDGGGDWCAFSPDGWPIVPDTVFMIELYLLFCVILFSYVHACKSISLLSNSAVLRRTAHRALSYVVIFIVCYIPYMTLQGATPQSRRHDLFVHATYTPLSVVEQITYLLYCCTGFFNVLGYGLRHWDVGYTLRRADSGSREARVVTFTESDRGLSHSSGSQCLDDFDEVSFASASSCLKEGENVPFWRRCTGNATELRADSPSRDIHESTGVTLVCT